MPETLIVGAEDLDKVMRLLQEYTQHLRSLCEQKINLQYRRLQIAIVTGMGIAAVFATFYIISSSYYDVSPTTRRILPVLASLLGTLGVAFASVYLSFGRRFQSVSEAEQVASTLERLIKLASQYAEHAQLRIGDRFEYELRLAEGEAALKTFNRVYQIEKPQNRLGRDIALDPDFIAALRFVIDDSRNAGFRYLVEHICGPVDKAVPFLLKSATFDDFIRNVGYKVLIRDDVGLSKGGAPPTAMAGAMSFGIPSSKQPTGWEKAEFLIQLDQTLVMNPATKAYFDWLYRELKKRVGK